jgi:hypothetical protein
MGIFELFNGDWKIGLRVGTIEDRVVVIGEYGFVFVILILGENLLLLLLH